ncbi:MAG: bifunctional phosphoribosylaminoimidazolecarboxamide formyltransferase/IMP cyclohydrolase [Ignavibacteria bacterium]
MKKLALISVSDKSNLLEFARGLTALDYEILATGNTAGLLTQNGIECTEISDYTSFPEIFSGRVKTLHPMIFGGILMRRDNESDIKQAEENKVYPIDIICVNLYPFPQVVNRTDVDLDYKIENIDIGGPSLIRAAAKNYQYVSVLTNIMQYEEFLEELKHGQVSPDTRKKLAAAAFSYTSYYDTLIANFMDKEFNLPQKQIRLNYPLAHTLRYGENPHQSAALFGNYNDYFEILHGKEVSYNNIIDINAAVELVQELGPDACAIIKHTNPCGAAIGSNNFEAYTKALSCDPVSAFGGIVAFDSIVDEKTAEALNDIFLEVICAPDYSPQALVLLKTRKNRRIIKTLKPLAGEKLSFKNVPGGIIAQQTDDSKLDFEKIKTVTNRKPDKSLMQDLAFAWIICKHVKSNAIVFVKNRKIIGVGAGQMSRIDSVRIAASKAKELGHSVHAAVAASDAFFPFADGINEIAAQGIIAVIQPGGSVRDKEIIEAADENNLSMVFSGIRNFKH